MSLTLKKPALPSDDKRWRIVNGTMRRHGFARDALIETLHTVQESFGYLDKPSLRFVAESLRVPLSQVYGVATFYHFFTLKPPASTAASFASAPPATSRARPPFSPPLKKPSAFNPAKPLPMPTPLSRPRAVSAPAALPPLSSSMATRSARPIPLPFANA